MKFGLNTGLRLAQVREEVGPEFKVIRENLNYKKETALKLFKNMTAADAEKYARDEDTPVADQIAIADIAYANKLGNGVADTDGDGKLDADDDDGCLQITGKSNFAEVQKRLIDRSIVLTTLNSVTPTLFSGTANNVQLIFNLGTATTPPTIQLEGSEDGVNFYSLGAPLTGVASSTVQLTLNDLSATFVRARVSTAGYVSIKAWS